MSTAGRANGALTGLPAGRYHGRDTREAPPATCLRCFAAAAVKPASLHRPPVSLSAPPEHPPSGILRLRAESTVAHGTAHVRTAGAPCSRLQRPAPVLGSKVAAPP